MANTIIKNHKIKTDISEAELRRIVVEVVKDVLNDPDFGLEVQDWVKKRLKKRPEKTIPFEEIKRKYQ